MGAPATVEALGVRAWGDDPGAIPGAGPTGRALAATVVVLVASLSLLLPVERGLPYIRLGPLPILPNVLLNLVAFGALFLARPRKTLRDLLHPPLFWQAVLTLLIGARALFSRDFNLGIAQTVSYGATWVAQFALMLSLVEWLGRKGFAKAYCIVPVIAALLGVLEGVGGIVLPPYQLLRDLYAVTMGYEEGYALVGGGRTNGPMGNSIVFSFAMVLSIPFAYDLPKRWMRWGAGGLFTFAALLTISRIGILMLIVLAVGAILRGGRAARAATVGLAILVSGVLVAATVFADNPIVKTWEYRLAGGQDSDGALNVRLRQEALSIALSNTFGGGDAENIVWGAGIRAGDRIGDALSIKVGTIDNAFVTILYEAGTIGLVVFLTAHGWHLRRLWGRYGPARLYWFNLLAGLGAGVAFVFMYTGSPNVPFVASLAVLGNEQRVRRRIKRAVAAREATPRAPDAPRGTSPPPLEA